MLNSIYTTAPITLSIQSTNTYGPRTVSELSEVYPWSTYSLLISQDTVGVWLEGLVMSGVRYWLPERSLLYRLDVAAGQSWSTVLGTVTLVSKDATVTSNGATYSGVYTYAVGSAPELWSFKPGFGVVRYSINGIDFNVSTAVSGAFLPQTSESASGGCPTPGLTSIPEDPTLTSAQREGALQLALNAGSADLVVGATWAELEPTQGTYRLDRITNELQLASKYNLPTVFNLRVPQSVAPALPAYLSGKKLSDTTVKSRLKKLLTAIAPRLPPQVKWVNVGYEVDTYAFTNPSEVSDYLDMFDTAYSQLKTLKPSVSVGQVFSFDMSRSSDQMFKLLAGHGDHIAFTYYAIGEGFAERDPSSPAMDIPLMTSMAAGKPVLLVEVGYSSGSKGESAQSQFLSNAMTALQQAGGAVPFFSIWSYQDLPASLVPSLSMQFGQTGPLFTQFITTTGLVTDSGAAKLAFNTFTSNARAFSSACNTTQ